MQKHDWLFKSTYILAVPLLATKAAQDLFDILRFAAGIHINHPLFLGIIGLIMLAIGLFKTQKILSIALILTGMWFLIAMSIELHFHHKIPTVYLLTVWLIGVIIISSYFYLQPNKNKGK